VLSVRQGKWMLNLYPPLLFQRIRVTQIGPGFRSAHVHVAKSVLTRNLHGTTFGGTIFSAADPMYAVMYWQIFARLGLRVRTWLKLARIEYFRPVQTSLSLEFALDDEEVERAHRALVQDGRFSRAHSTSAVDDAGRTCAEIETEVYLRLPRVGERKEASAF
jgi:acyl-coenzyme A thioesterase PaaI-like protein